MRAKPSLDRLLVPTAYTITAASCFFVEHL